jgi:hypothetical protein
MINVYAQAMNGGKGNKSSGSSRLPQASRDQATKVPGSTMFGMLTGKKDM